MMTDSNSQRVDIAIEKLTIISSNLDKLLSVHEERINRQEKQLGNFETNLEKRREEHQKTMEDVYDKMRKEDKNILDEITKLRDEAKLNNDKTNQKITKIEQSIWLYMGGLSVIVFLLTYGQSFIKLLAVASH